MSDQFSFIIRIALVAFLVTLLWAASIAFTYWDTHHKGLASGKVFAWLAIVTLLPFIGFTAYILFRALSLYLSPKIKRLEPKIRRETLLKPPPLKRKPMPTISASELDIHLVQVPQKTMQASALQRPILTKYIVTIESAAGSVKEFVLEALPARIGRGSEASVRLDGDLGVSRNHAEIYEQAGNLRIRDMHSTHGTHVNGLRIADKNLDSGDRIRVGSTTLVVKIVKE